MICFYVEIRCTMIGRYLLFILCLRHIYLHTYWNYIHDVYYAYLVWDIFFLVFDTCSFDTPAHIYIYIFGFVAGDSGRVCEFLRYVDAGGPTDVDAKKGSPAKNCCWKKLCSLIESMESMVYLHPARFHMEHNFWRFGSDHIPWKKWLISRFHVNEPRV